MLLEELEYHPDLYLDEMQWFLAEHFDLHVDISTIAKRLKKADWTNKAIKTRALEAVAIHRNHYKIMTSDYRADQFVFVDESGVDNRDIRRRRGWAPKGHTPWQQKLLRRGQRFNILPALTIDGIITSQIYVGSTESVGFDMWIEKKVLPLMNHFPGPRSVLVMDNASFHHSKEIKDLVEGRGVVLQYLPPYSPDFNPIEAFFGHLKKQIRRQGKWRSSEFDSADEFGNFLSDQVDAVSYDVKQIKGFFKAAGAGIDLRD